MIYESLQSTFEAVDGLYVQLDDALQESAASALAGGNSAAAITLNGLSFQANAEAAAARSDAAAASGQPGLVAAIGFGLGRVQARQAGRDALELAYRPVAAALGPSGDRSRCERLLARLRELLQQTRQELEEAGTTPQGPAVNLARMRSTVDDLAAYPVLTSDSGGSGGSLSGGSGTAGGGTASGTVQRTVDLAIRQVLGSLP